MNRHTLLVAMSVLALPLAANAQTAGGLYFSIGAGVNLMQQEGADAVVESAPVPEAIGEVLTAAGPALTVAFGRGLHKSLRVEIEGGWRSNQITGESGFGEDNDETGRETKYGVMGNALFDFNVRRVKPYVGGGIGAQFVHEPGANVTDGPIVVIVPPQTKGSFAYQVIAGMAFAIQNVRGLSVTGEYRFLGLAGTRTYTGTATIAGVGSFPVTDRSSDDRNHSITLGIRYAFGG